MITLKDVRSKLNPSTASFRNGVFTIRREFFWGITKPNPLPDAVRAAFPEAIVLESGTVLKPFKGGAGAAENTHWFVKFTEARSHWGRKGVSDAS